jgi:hypothetical protein
MRTSAYAIRPQRIRLNISQRLSFCDYVGFLIFTHGDLLAVCGSDSRPAPTLPSTYRRSHGEAEPGRDGRGFFVLRPRWPDMLSEGLESVASTRICAR